jgi:hypothetical protein
MGPPITGCAQATASWTAQASGTATFGADGTVNVNTTLGLTETLGVPPACLGTADCTSLQMSLQSQVPPGGSASCTGAASSGCTCTQVIAPQPDTSSGAYMIQGTSITYGPGTYAEPYCVQGNTLVWQSTNANGFVYILTATQ